MTAKRRGVTVAEGLVSLTLAILILSIVGTLLSRVSAASMRANERDNILQSNLVTLGRMAAECRSATVWTSPARTQTAAVTLLDFQVPDLARDATRLPLPLPGANGPPWNPRRPLFQCGILYQLNASKQLTRTVTFNGVPSTTTVAEGVQALNFQRVTKSDLLLAMTLQDSAKTRVQITTRLPLIDSWSQP